MKRLTSALDYQWSAYDNSIAVVDDFLSLADCRRMLNETNSGEWVDSAVARANGGAAITRGGRRSASLVLPAYGDWAEGRLRVIECRLAAMFGVQPQNLEPWQMTRYRRGDSYDYHVDCGAWARHPSGERNRTILIVLEQPSRGGATHFRALRQTIRPLAGRLVVWRNLLPTGMCNYAMIHSGRPIWQGRKTILTTWERQRPYVGYSKESDMAKGRDDKVIKEIIRHYGETLDLKSSPYVIVEIIRRYSPRLDGSAAASCQPPGGPPKVFDPSDIIQELKAKVAELNRLSTFLEQALKTKKATKAK